MEERTKSQSIPLETLCVSSLAILTFRFSPLLPFFPISNYKVGQGKKQGEKKAGLEQNSTWATDQGPQ